MTKKNFTAEHINVEPDDLMGNNGIGRYILLPGSPGRARAIAEQFHNVKEKKHPRGHDIYLGSITDHGKTIDVATVHTGMGCPSTEIILHELYHLGGKRFLRVGTAGSLQPNLVKIGDIVNAEASVRDEDTTTHYAPSEFPATASIEFISAINSAAEKLKVAKKTHTGVVHCKSSLYAREFGAGPLAAENQAYLKLLENTGVLASEMETATLFIQTQIYDHQLLQLGKGPQYRVFAGAILSIMSYTDYFPDAMRASQTEEMIQLALESIRALAQRE